MTLSCYEADVEQNGQSARIQHICADADCPDKNPSPPPTK